MSAGAVSVVIPTYNRAALAPRAVESALSQCRPGDEVIVIDDGSTDDTESRLVPYRERIVYVKQANGGVSRARNAGLERARNPLIAFLDSDDEWLPGKLELERAALAAVPEAVICFTDMRGVFPSGKTTPKLVSYYAGRDLIDFLGPGRLFSDLAPLPPGIDDFVVHVGDLYREQMDRPWAQIGTVMIRSSVLADPEIRFPTDLRVSEDAEFVARVSRCGPAVYLDRETELFHQHEGERLTDADALEFADGRLKSLERVWGSDEAFLSVHADAYRAAVRSVELLRVRILLAAGRREEARAALARIARAPLTYRALSLLPGALVSAVARLRAPRR